MFFTFRDISASFQTQEFNRGCKMFAIVKTWWVLRFFRAPRPLLFEISYGNQITWILDWFPFDISKSKGPMALKNRSTPHVMTIAVILHSLLNSLIQKKAEILSKKELKWVPYDISKSKGFGVLKIRSTHYNVTIAIIFHPLLNSWVQKEAKISLKL